MIAGYMIVFGFLFLLFSALILGATRCFQSCRKRVVPSSKPVAEVIGMWDDYPESEDDEIDEEERQNSHEEFRDKERTFEINCI